MNAPYYQDDLVTLYHGDYRDVLAQLDAVDVVICDPPYSEQVHSNTRSAKMLANDRGGRYGADVRRNVDLGFEYLSEEERDLLAAEFSRLARRWVLVFSDVESDHLWRESLTGHGLDYVRTGAWIKTGSTPQFSGDRPATGFEAITIAHPKGRKRWNGGGQHAIWQVPIVLNRSRKDPRYHTTQKPLPLMTALVDLFSEPGEVILDATAGSGTTGVAAKRLGRRAVLIEREEKYCEATAGRLQGEVSLDFADVPLEVQGAFDFDGERASGWVGGAA